MLVPPPTSGFSQPLHCEKSHQYYGSGFRYHHFLSPQLCALDKRKDETQGSTEILVLKTNNGMKWYIMLTLGFIEQKDESCFINISNACKIH